MKMINILDSKKLSGPKKQITDLIDQVVKELELPEVDYTIEHPSSSDHGDYSCNIALILSKKVGKNPLEIAKEVVETISFESKIINQKSQISIAGPGFINFHLSQDWLTSELKSILKSQNYGYNQTLESKKVMVEYTDPNPFKVFHIGHLYSNAVGESLARVFEAQGAEVKRADFFGDVGMHVAKAIYGLTKDLNLNLSDPKSVDKELKKLAKKPLTQRIKIMGQAYAHGATAYKEDKDSQSKIKELNFYIYISAQKLMQKTTNYQPQVDYKKHLEVNSVKLESVYSLYTTGRSWSLDYFETVYDRLGTKFDFYYPESITGEIGYPLVKEYLKKGVFEKSKGAVIFAGSKHGLHDRVFINSLGLPTYECKDLGLAVAKYNDFKYDLSLPVTGNEINEYFQVVLKAVSFINPELAVKNVHIGHGMVRLPEGKMSSRTGKVLGGEWLINESKSRLKESYPEMDEKTAEMVAVGAVKYALLKSQISKDTIFNFEESISFEGNSGPYLQYTYARCKSVLAKASRPPSTPLRQGYKGQAVSGNAQNSEELEVLRILYRFPEIVFKSAQELAPHKIAEYLYDLAQKYNSFYNKRSILEAKTEESKQFRLALTQATAKILKNGLYLMGVKTPERM